MALISAIRLCCIMEHYFQIVKVFWMRLCQRICGRDEMKREQHLDLGSSSRRKRLAR